MAGERGLRGFLMVFQCAVVATASLTMGVLAVKQVAGPTSSETQCVSQFQI